jgi:hypothetical protein
MRCARHPRTQTDLTCGRCDTPICPRCLVHTEVGIRCPKCAPRSRSHVLTSLLGWLVLFPLWRAVFRPPALQALFSIATAATWAALILVLLAPRLVNREATHSAPFALPTSPAIPPGPPPPTVPPFDLVLVRYNCTVNRSTRVTDCTGSVRNSSGRNLEHVQVIVALMTEDGTTQTTTIGPIDYDPLLPDQESPWTLAAAFNPLLTKYTVTFRTASGQPLRTQKETP